MLIIFIIYIEYEAFSLSHSSSEIIIRKISIITEIINTIKISVSNNELEISSRI